MTLTAHRRSLVVPSFLCAIASLLLAVVAFIQPAQALPSATERSAEATSTTNHATSLAARDELEEEHIHEHGFELFYYDDDVAPVGGGKVVPASDDITSFRPGERSEAVKEAEKISLRNVFDTLGEETAIWYQHVLALADPYMEGRAPGTHGIEVAADYIEWNMKQIGLEPAFKDNKVESTDSAWNTYRQPFDFTYMGAPSKVTVATADIDGEKLKDGTDFVVFGNSGTDDITGAITFVGYAIDSGPNSYTSFAREDDLTGRIALVLRYEPLNSDGHSKWSDERFSANAALVGKLRACTERGAKAIVVVNPPGAVDANEGLETLEASSRYRPRMDVPVIQVTPELADKLVKQADQQGRDLMTLRTMADDGETTAIHFKDSVNMHIATDVQPGRLETENVGGILRGKGDLADQWVVIGGHYDHIGYGYTGVRDRENIGIVHPGADDNASGTAGVLILANRMKQYYDAAPDDASLRSVLFLTFSAEEAGLFGSRAFVNDPSIPLENVNIMINFDMIGRLRSDELSVSGTGTAKEFDELLLPHFEASGLTIKSSRGGRGPSDHANFFNKGIPVLFPFTGLHDEYHTAADKGFTVNPAGAMRVIDLTQAIAMDFVSRPERLTFVKDTTPEDIVAPQRATGVRLGVMPAYGAELEKGVLIDSVSPESAAAKGGLKDGDTIIAWNGDELEGASALMTKLRASKPGDKIKLSVLRDNKPVELEVTLEAQSSNG